MTGQARKFLAVAAIAFAIPCMAFAQSAAEIQSQIDAHNAQIDALNKEIAQYQRQLDQVSAKKQTLQSTISSLNLSIKKTTASINVTQNQIGSTELQIKQLSNDISDRQDSIDQEHAGLAEIVRSIARADAQPLPLQMLSEDSLADTWRDIDAADQLQSALGDHIAQITKEKADLTDTRTKSELKRADLVAQQATLKSQQGSLNAQKSTQNELLSQTKNQESSYQKIIAEKKAQEAAFEEAINELQAKLKAADTSSIPKIGSGVLSWPLDNMVPRDCTSIVKLASNQSCITQYFGNTAFSRTAAYNGQGHNGIDLRAPIGTPVKAALTGTVEDINLGVAPNCQYGKWVLIKHNNGLTTLYAHLSSIIVSPGDAVSTGQVIGYSGQTGYATGPHLHFTVYASSGVTFTNYKCNSGIRVKIPISPFNGYLNPLDYL